MVVSIIGAGALGKLYGGLLSLSGHDVHFLMRSEYETIRAQKQYALYFKEHDTSLSIESPQIYKEASELPPSDLVIIALKTTDNADIKSHLSKVLKKDSTVLVVQNGIGNEEYIQSFCPTQTIISAISTAAATRAEDAKVDIFFIGELRVAHYQGDNGEIIKDISDWITTNIKPKIVSYDNYKFMRWEKLIWSIPFCALSIIYDKPADIIASTKPFINVAQGIISEIQDIAASVGVEISNDYAQKTVEITRKVKNYYPSMYWDYVHKRPIEKEYIFDNVIKISKANHVATPYLNLIKTKLEEMVSA